MEAFVLLIDSGQEVGGGALGFVYCCTSGLMKTECERDVCKMFLCLSVRMCHLSDQFKPFMFLFRSWHIHPRYAAQLCITPPSSQHTHTHTHRGQQFPPHAPLPIPWLATVCSLSSALGVLSAGCHGGALCLSSGGGQPGSCRCLGGTKLFLDEVLLVPGQNKAKFEAVLREIKSFKCWEFLKTHTDTAVPYFCVVCG